MSTFVAKVKNLLSGDTFVLVPQKSTQVPVPERIVSLLHVRAGDSFESKDELRRLLIGKAVKVTVEHKAASGREFGDLKTPVFDLLVEYGLSKGLYKLRDGESDPGLQDLESKARTGQLGLWSSVETAHEVPLDEKIIEKSQKSPVSVVVERVISGDRVVARLLCNKTQHVVTPVLLAGIRLPRTDDDAAPVSTTRIGHLAKQFVEEKLLTTTVPLKVSILGASQSGIPVALFVHPSGNNICEKLLEQGYAEVVDWQSSLVGASTMSTLRKAEQTARALGRGLFGGNSSGGGPVSTNAGSSGSSGVKGKLTAKLVRPGSHFDATVAKVISGDTILIRLPSDEELTVQLASVRAPRPNDAQLSANASERMALVNSAREFLRGLVIGKQVSVYVDGVRPANSDLGLEERFVVTIKANFAGGNTKDLSEELVSSGWASVIKHNKATANERSLNWDRLVEIEQEQQKLAKRGIYSTGDKLKTATVSLRVVDASENIAKAKTFFTGLKKKGRIGGYHIEYIPSANRVKLFNPKEGMKLTLILGGLSNSRGESAEEGLKFMNRKFLQRNVEFEVYDQDKVGGFIGNLFATQKSLEPVSVSLVEQGFVGLHEFSLSSNSFASELTKAEEKAKAAKKGIWSLYDAAAEEAKASDAAQNLQSLRLEAAKPKFFDVEVTYVDDTGVLSFQLKDGENNQKFKTFESSFAQFHLQQPSASQASVDLPHNLSQKPKNGEIVSARIDKEGTWSRVKVLSFDKYENKFDVKDIDFGTEFLLPLANLRVLPAQYGVKQIPGFARTTVLQNIRLPPSKPTDYVTDALYALEDLTYEKSLVVSALPYGKNGIEFSSVLYDSEKSLVDQSYTINKEFVRKGWGLLDKRQAGIATKEYDDELLVVQEIARKGHSGCWEFGDITFDDDLE